MSLCQNSEPCMLNMEMNLLCRWVLVKNLLELVWARVFFPPGGWKSSEGGCAVICCYSTLLLRGSKRRHAWVTVTCRVWQSCTGWTGRTLRISNRRTLCRLVLKVWWWSGRWWWWWWWWWWRRGYGRWWWFATSWRGRGSCWWSFQDGGSRLGTCIIIHKIHPVSSWIRSWVPFCDCNCQSVSSYGNRNSCPDQFFVIETERKDSLAAMYRRSPTNKPQADGVICSHSLLMNHSGF